MKRHHLKQMALFTELIICISFVSRLALAEDDLFFQDNFSAFGTLVTISIYGLAQDHAQQISAAVIKDINRMHGFWQPWQPGPLGRINHLLPTGGRFYMPPSTLPLFEQSIELSRKSHYLFNPAIGRLVQIWGFDDVDNMRHTPPSAEKINALVKQRPTLDDLQLNGLQLSSTNEAVLLDFGAFAKGVAVDKSIARLRELGVNNAIINAGGDLRAIGKRGNRAWYVGVKHPRANGIMATIETSGDESIFTSGDYERFFIHNKQRYHHIIDPRTGYPSNNSMSVTVIHSQAATADAAATALFIAGPKQWRQTAKNMGVSLVMLVGHDKKIYLSSAMAKRIKIQSQPGYQIVEGGP